MPAVGFALGIDRIMLGLEQLGRLDPRTMTPQTDYAVIPFDEATLQHAVRLVRRLREEGAIAELAEPGRSIGKQLEAAGKRGARNAVLIGPDEVASGRATVRELTTGREHSLQLAERNVRSRGGRSRIPARAALAASGLLVEGSARSGAEPPGNSYYGFNVTKSDREPVEQIHGFIAARRLSDVAPEHVDAPSFFPFVAGLFEVLNTRSPEELATVVEEKTRREQYKERLFQRALGLFGIGGRVVLTREMWGSSHFWDVVSELIESGRYSRKSLTADTMRWFRSETELAEYQTFGAVAEAVEGIEVPRSALKRIADWPAPILYTPLEVAEARYMAEILDVRIKLGHMEEKVYDKYIAEFMDVFHLRQPVDLASTRTKPKTVTPYIAKVRRGKPELRLYYEDALDDIVERVEPLEFEDYVFAISSKAGEVLHPLLDKLVLAVESARAMGEPPVSLGGGSIEHGSDLIDLALRGELAVEELKSAMPQIAYRYLVQPYRDLVPARAAA
jgi:hypothetical protein